MLDPSIPPHTIEEWQWKYPNDEIKLYPDRPIPREPVYHLK
jgi:hypothetical protein